MPSVADTPVGAQTVVRTPKIRPFGRPGRSKRSSTPGSMRSPRAPSPFGEKKDVAAVRDPVKQYLDWCGRFDRLTREEEIELSKRALDGDTDAQDHLVNANLRLVVRICKDFTRGKFPLLDLVSAGNEGLIVASRKYDGDMGVPFGNYASIWIKQRVMKYVAEHGFHVRVPPYRAAIVNQVVRENTRLSQELDRPATAEEVAEAVSCTLDEIREVLRLLQAPLELDKPMKEEGDTATFGAYFGEDVEEADERLNDDLHQVDMKRAVADALSCLPDREAQVLVWFFGLNGQRAIDLEQVAQRLGVSRERARQIKSHAIKKLNDENSLLKYLA